MKKFILTVLCILGLSLFNTSVFADNSKINLQNTTPVSSQVIQSDDKCNLKGLNEKSAEVKSGCCFKHGGVCGCFNGKTRCCSGETNDKCPCRSGDTKMPESPKTPNDNPLG